MRRFPRLLLGLFLAALLSIAPPAATQQAPSKYVVPQALFDAVATEYSGEHALDNVRGITQFHRIQASPGFTQAREWVVARLASYGITDVEVEKFPSDGRTRYSTYVGPMAWTVREGELWVDAPPAPSYAAAKTGIIVTDPIRPSGYLREPAKQ